MVPSLESDIASYYNQDAERRAKRAIEPRRVEQRETFTRDLVLEKRRRLIELGVGPGRDARWFADQGLAVVGVDLSVEHVRLCLATGVEALVSSVQHLPFADDSFDAAWTMSTLVHVPDADFDSAMDEIRRVLVPGSPVAIGLWGGADAELINSHDDIYPQRFFSIRSDDRIRDMLSHHGHIESFATWAPDGPGRWTYQWALLRTR